MIQSVCRAAAYIQQSKEKSSQEPLMFYKPNFSFHLILKVTQYAV